ncbi:MULTISPECIES: complex I NDUFA9 subunit family protein [Methylosinus]|uniref:Complex I NDUFA9 subunit family protein n=1 Tax=Methylosinus trichosporium (strain ATCC 35070 / NCIMB 11131 / UNIQEM 75 / OB3b) TaxID=595536 RepID=A0A2D2CZB3_METT3|nr:MULTISPECIES: complex I NDUFA9 subunit family protein [Methylosinus]ATQ68083.1 complex I NDUFA9 subunit family protein [Methylosinus trichosporium OB3b]OBS54354.1 3-beta hydroxysteroid dehydrogenase [Methylosinus sp. 3S-1]
MSADVLESGRLVTVFGGSGFIGRHVVGALARDGWRIRVACRRPDLAFHLQPLGKVGQIFPIQANLRNKASIAAAVKGADAVVNLVGILAEGGKQSFSALHAEGAKAVAEAAEAAGAIHFVQISALGADAHSTSVYARTKAAGEAAVREAFPAAVIFRPSVVFGPEDDFFNRFATMARYFPVIPVVGEGTRFQPVYVGDVARAVALAVDGRAAAGATYELGGPEVKSFRELVQYVLEVTERDRRILPMSFLAGKKVALITKIAGALSFGLFPKLLSMTPDQVELLRHDNVVSAQAKSTGMTLEGLGLAPTAIEAIVPSYLYRYRKTGQYQAQRLA